jgi:hypothetical protein
MKSSFYLSLVALSGLLSSELHAEEVIYHEDFSQYTANILAEEIHDHFTWSEFPHPLNPTTVEANGDLALVLNSSLAYQNRAGSTVTLFSKYQEVQDRVSFYANVAFNTPLNSPIGVSIKINRDYQAIVSFDASIAVEKDGQITVRIDETDPATGVRRPIAEKNLPGFDPTKSIALGLRISRLTGLVELLIAREPVLSTRLTKIDLAKMPNIYSPGIFAYNGQSARFDDLTFILNEKNAD